jgi:ketosteroid isomerase-like protein
VALHRTAKSHGVQLEDRVAHVIMMREGRITRTMGFVTLGEALEAAGLSR